METQTFRSFHFPPYESKGGHTGKGIHIRVHVCVQWFVVNNNETHNGQVAFGYRPRAENYIAHCRPKRFAHVSWAPLRLGICALVVDDRDNVARVHDSGPNLDDERIEVARQVCQIGSLEVLSHPPVLVVSRNVAQGDGGKAVEVEL